MPTAVVGDKEFLEMVEQLGIHEVARKLKLGVRGVFARRRRLELKLNRGIDPPPGGYKPGPRFTEHKQRHHVSLRNGTVIVASDCHYWPGHVTTAHRALLAMCASLEPTVVVLNGDVLDGATISRHAPIGWEGRPTLISEIEACKERLSEIEKAAKGADLVWCLGNHDARFETRLATVAPEYARIHGVHLKDHFPKWRPAYSVWINNHTVIKHRWKGGVHATHNNTVQAGTSIITGHLHSAKVTPYSDYTGTRYGVDTGCIAEPYSEIFVHYTEDSPVNWRSGFGVLTFKEHRLLQPELVLKFGNNAVEFRGQVIKV